MTPPEPYGDEEINLRDYWRVLVRRRWLVIGCTVATALAAAVFSFLQPNIYQSKATLVPLGQAPGGLRAALGELGGLLPAGPWAQRESRRAAHGGAAKPHLGRRSHSCP
ncbi:MAG: hypothetical protein KatS3mg131_0770 [Candidatus Tectimicrobiota bacterium]|nr:MAG: hypothetical protein KatS3mg131_0770 [Candidatus Tectomicrobia bacterium]